MATNGHRRWRQGLLIPFKILLVPDRYAPPAVVTGKSGSFFLIAILAALFAALAVGAKLDMAPSVMAQNAQMGPTDGANGDSDNEQATKTDTEIADEISHAKAVSQVMMGLDAALGTPLRMLGLALVLFLLARYIGGEPTMARCLTAAGIAALPIALKALFVAIAAFLQPAILPERAEQILSGITLPLAEQTSALARVLSGVDMFLVWSVVILVFGFAAAAGISRKKSFITVVVGFVLYLLITRLIFGGGSPPMGVTQ